MHKPEKKFKKLVSEPSAPNTAREGIPDQREGNQININNSNIINTLNNFYINANSPPIIKFNPLPDTSRISNAPSPPKEPIVGKFYI